MTRLPRAARMACWFTAWAEGRCSLDDARDGVLAEDAAHDVLGLEPEPVPVVLALGLLRGRGAERATLALPVPGDLTGLGGPPAFNNLALEAGQAVLLPGAGLGLVPSAVGAGVTWSASQAEAGRSVPDLAEADRQLRDRVREEAGRLAELDVARWRPEVAAELAGARQPGCEPFPPGQPVRAQQLAAMALRCHVIAERALDDDGGSVTSYEAAQRRDALLRLQRCARHALVAACSVAGPVP